jgi:CheY-like chemotaxis protein
VKYTRPGGRIHLNVGRNETEVLVRIRDNGVGIPQHLLSQVFEMFAQVDRSLEKSRGGLGIGLNIARRLAEMHGGSIEARSDGPGAGSEFTVRLPVIMSLVSTLPAETGKGEVFMVTSHRVLIVDDHEGSAAMMGIMCRALGNDVRTAHDGIQAVEVAAEFRPDVIFLDIGMPRLNGYDACRRIREQPWSRDTMIVALTGWGQEEDRRQAEEAGFSRHLVKPVDPNTIRELLAELKPPARSTA